MKCLCGCGTDIVRTRTDNKGYVKGHQRSWLGKKRLDMIGNTRGFTKGHAPYNKGKKRPELSGVNHWNWKGGVSPRMLNTPEYKAWRKSVFERDNYTCQFCGKYGGELNADHIKQWSLYPDLRFELSNGRTLCVPCHKTTFIFHGNRYIKGVFASA